MRKLISIFLISNLILLSCSDYLDVNSSTNNPYTADLTPADFLAASLSTPYRIQATTMNEYGSVMTNTWSGNVNAFTGVYREEFTLNFNTSSRAGIWDNLYTGLYNLNNILNIPDDSNKYIYHKSIARIMKVYYMQYIVDIYGDAPYSDAFKSLEKLRPQYDDDKSIYKTLFTELDLARSAIANAPTTAANPTSTQDIMFAGDMDKWVEFANTVELKMTLRLSESTEPDVVILRTNRISNLSAKAFISYDAKINPGYNGSAPSEQNPFYNTWGPNSDGSSAGTSRRRTVASGYIASVLMGTANNTHINTTGVIDRRNRRMFAGGETVGVIQGDVTTNAGGGAPGSPSRLGPGVLGYAGNDSYENGSGKDGYVMLESESLFLQSEAAFRYPTFAGNPETLFKAGITASFNHYNLPVGNYVYPFATEQTDMVSVDAASYIINSENLLGIGWTGTPNKIEAILTQKWLAMTGINGIEPYLDSVRTGFPNTPFSIIAPAGATKPKRLLYPLSEYTANSANVPNLILSQIFVKNQFTPFWIK